MKSLWTLIDKSKLSYKNKICCFLTVLIIIFGLLGGLCWYLLGRYFLPQWSWLLCFVGYPAVFGGFFAGILYICNHEFS